MSLSFHFNDCQGCPNLHSRGETTFAESSEEHNSIRHTSPRRSLSTQASGVGYPTSGAVEESNQMTFQPGLAFFPTSIFVEPGVLQPTSASKILYLTPDNVKKCTITLDLKDPEQTQYIVDSNLELTYMHVRRPYDPPDQPLATLQRREVLPDKISFRGGEKIKVKSWLRPLKAFSTFPAAFEENGTTYVWDASIVGQLSMYKASEPDTPIAWFQSSRKLVMDGVPTVLPAFLVLQPDAADIQDLTVVSFLILEQKARMSNKRTELLSGRAVHGVSAID